MARRGGDLCADEPETRWGHSEPRGEALERRAVAPRMARRKVARCLTRCAVEPGDREASSSALAARPRPPSVSPEQHGTRHDVESTAPRPSATGTPTATRPAIQDASAG